MRWLRTPAWCSQAPADRGPDLEAELPGAAGGEGPALPAPRRPAAWSVLVLTLLKHTHSIGKEKKALNTQIKHILKVQVTLSL